MKNENTPERELPENDTIESADNRPAEPETRQPEDVSAGTPETAAAGEEGDTLPAEDASEPPVGNDGAAREKGKKEKKKREKKEKPFRDTRKLRYGGMATALTAVVVAVVVLINVVGNILSDRFPLNLDLTSDKLYTLTDDSKEVAKGIDKEVEIIAFMEEEVFASPNTGTDALNSVLKQFHEAVKQYDNLSGGKVKVSYIDLNSDPTLYTKYSEYEVTGGDILFLCGNRYQKVSYVDLFSYDEETAYTTGEITNFQSKVEQVLASKLAMVTSDVTPEVLFLTGHDEEENTVSGIQSILEVNNYTVKSLDITGSEEYSEDAVMAVIAAPTKDYSEDELSNLRAWLDNDGKKGRQLIVIVNYEADCPNLYEFLNVEYGLEVTNNLVQETDSNRVYQWNANYIYGDIGSSDYTADLAGNRVLMPVTRQILTHHENDTQKTLYNTPLVTFPESSRLVRMQDALSEEDGAEVTQFEADEYPIVGAAQATEWGYNSNNERVETNVIVLGSNQMVMSGVTSMTTVYNEQMVLGLANGMTGNESTVQISNKPLDQEMLEFTTGQSYIFLGIFVIAVPLALLIACLVIFLRRRRL